MYKIEQTYEGFPIYGYDLNRQVNCDLSFCRVLLDSEFLEADEKWEDAECKYQSLIWPDLFEKKSIKEFEGDVFQTDLAVKLEIVFWSPAEPMEEEVDEWIDREGNQIWKANLVVISVKTLISGYDAFTQTIWLEVEEWDIEEEEYESYSASFFNSLPRILHFIKKQELENLITWTEMDVKDLYQERAIDRLYK